MPENLPTTRIGVYRETLRGPRGVVVGVLGAIALVIGVAPAVIKEDKWLPWPSSILVLMALVLVGMAFLLTLEGSYQLAQRARKQSEAAATEVQMSRARFEATPEARCAHVLETYDPNGTLGGFTAAWFLEKCAPSLSVHADPLGLAMELNRRGIEIRPMIAGELINILLAHKTLERFPLSNAPHEFRYRITEFGARVVAILHEQSGGIQIDQADQV